MCGCVVSVTAVGVRKPSMYVAHMNIYMYTHISYYLYTYTYVTFANVWCHYLPCGKPNVYIHICEYMWYVRIYVCTYIIHIHMYFHLLDLWMCRIITSRGGKKAQYVYTHIMNICMYIYMYVSISYIFICIYIRWIMYLHLLHL